MTISLHFLKVLNDIYIRFNHLLENLDQNWIDAESFAEAIHSAGSPLDNCWGFIDGTLRPWGHEAWSWSKTFITTAWRKVQGSTYIQPVWRPCLPSPSAFTCPLYRGAMLTPAQELFNKRMSKVWESVEWTFGKVVQYFAFLDFQKNLKVLLQPIRKYCVVGVLLINCHTCLYGSVTSDYFSLPPPDLHTYLNW